MNGPFKNLGVKLAALLLATLLWFHVATEKTIQYNISLPIKQVDLSNDLVLTDPPGEEIEVLVSASGKRLLRSDWKKAGLKLTLSRTISGRFKADLNNTNISLIKSDGLELLEVIAPRELTLSSDRLMEAELPVKSNITITPDEGFVLSRVNTIIPKTVKVIGPRRYIMNLDSIETNEESYKGIRNDLKLNIPLVYPDETYGLTIAPDTVSFMVGVSPIKSREFENIAIDTVGFPDRGIVDWQPRRMNLRLGGESGLIDSVAVGDLRIVADFSRIDTLGNIPLKFNLPPRITLLKKDADTVRITF